MESVDEGKMDKTQYIYMCMNLWMKNKIPLTQNSSSHLKENKEYFILEAQMSDHGKYFVLEVQMSNHGPGTKIRAAPPQTMF